MQGPVGFGVTASLPDLEEEDISLLAEPGNVLTITAERTIKRTVLSTFTCDSTTFSNSSSRAANRLSCVSLLCLSDATENASKGHHLV